MATMKLYELVNHYHIGTELTCAEAMFMACNEYYHLNLSEETRKMFSVMGLGFRPTPLLGGLTPGEGVIGGDNPKKKSKRWKTKKGNQTKFKYTKHSGFF